jgi:hypothetical protein
VTDGDRERLREGITSLLRSLAGDGFGPVWVDDYSRGDISFEQSEETGERIPRRVKPTTVRW